MAVQFGVTPSVSASAAQIENTVTSGLGEGGTYVTRLKMKLQNEMATLGVAVEIADVYIQPPQRKRQECN